MATIYDCDTPRYERTHLSANSLRFEILEILNEIENINLRKRSLVALLVEHNLRHESVGLYPVCFRFYAVNVLLPIP